MIQAAHDAARRTPRFAVLQQMQLLVPLRRRQRRVHEVVRVLQERLVVLARAVFFPPRPLQFFLYQKEMSSNAMRDDKERRVSIELDAQPREVESKASRGLTLPNHH